MIMPEQLTLAPPICRFAGEVFSIGRRVMQKCVVSIDCIPLRGHADDRRKKAGNISSSLFSWTSLVSEPINSVYSFLFHTLGKKLHSGGANPSVSVGAVI